VGCRYCRGYSESLSLFSTKKNLAEWRSVRREKQKNFPAKKQLRHLKVWRPGPKILIIKKMANAGRIQQ
jgi:hypothetical protein